jgi:hypothetical protein
VAPKSQKRKTPASHTRQRQPRKSSAATPSVNKVDRAGEHIEQLRRLVQAWFRRDSYTIVSERDAKTGYTVARAKISEPPSPAIALVAGDAAHNLRSALDHLALRLNLAYNISQLPEGEIEKLSEFPILDTEFDRSGQPRFRRLQQGGAKKRQPAPKSGLAKLLGAHPEAIQAIEDIQPYKRGKQFASDPLWMINELDRIDKHRRPNLTAYAGAFLGIGPAKVPKLPAKTDFDWTATLIPHKVSHKGPVEDGTEIAAVTVNGANVALHFAQSIAFNEATIAPASSDLIDVLEDLRDYVRGTVTPALEEFL